MSKDKIRELNDAFRKNPLVLGRLCVTRSITMMPGDFTDRLLKAVREFDDFDHANDPWSEHDFIAVEIDGRKLFGKIDYYARDDKTMSTGSEDPADPEKTLRVLTLMFCEEY